MAVVEYLRWFRFSFFLLGVALLAFWVEGTWMAYQHIDTLVINETTQAGHFGFTSSVTSHGRRVLFRGHIFPYPIRAGDRIAMGHDLERERILGVYAESGGVKMEVPCPANFSFYRAEISKAGVRCEGSNGKFPRLGAALSVSPLIAEGFLRNFLSLLEPGA